MREGPTGADPWADRVRAAAARHVVREATRPFVQPADGYQSDEAEAERLILGPLGGILLEDWRPFRDKEWRGVRDTISGEVVRWKAATP